eukprot:RCo007985
MSCCEKDLEELALPQTPEGSPPTGRLRVSASTRKRISSAPVRAVGELRAKTMIRTTQEVPTEELGSSRHRPGSAYLTFPGRTVPTALQGVKFPVVGFTGRFCGFYSPMYSSPFTVKAREVPTAFMDKPCSTFTAIDSGSENPDYHKHLSADLKYLREISKYRRSAFPAAERHTFFKFRADREPLKV